MTEQTQMLVEIECPGCHLMVQWVVSLGEDRHTSLPEMGCHGNRCTEIHRGGISTDDERIQRAIDDDVTPVVMGVRSGVRTRLRTQVRHNFDEK